MVELEEIDKSQNEGRYENNNSHSAGLYERSEVVSIKKGWQSHPLFAESVHYFTIKLFFVMLPFSVVRVMK